MAHDVFISYSSHDKAIADAVCATLESRKVRCWIAPRDVLPGMAYAEALVNAIHQAKVFVIVFSASANDSPQVMREVERAVNLEIPIIPFRIEDIKPSKSMEYFLSTPHWLDAITPPLELHLQKLADTVELLLSSQVSSKAQAGLLDKSSFEAKTRKKIKPIHVAISVAAVAFCVAGILLAKGLFKGGTSPKINLNNSQTTAATSNSVDTTTSSTTIPTNAASSTIIANSQHTVAYWTFDEMQGNILHDVSGNNNNGTIQGAEWVEIDGRKCLDFDGVDDYISIANESNFNLNAFTIEAIIRVSDISQDQWIVSKGPLYGNYTLEIDGDNDTYWPRHLAYVHECQGGNFSIVGSSSLPYDTFVHVAVTFDGNTIKLFVNGNLEREMSNVPTPILNDDPVLIGAGGYNGLSTFFNGYIAALRISNIALSPADFIGF
jgi:hypothetical protein